MKTRIIFLFASFVSFNCAAATVVNDSIAASTNDTLHPLVDYALAAEIDSITTCFYEDLLYTSKYLGFEDGVHDDSIVAFDEELLKERLATLDQYTPFDLTYNDIVKAFINLYVNKKRNLSEKCLGRAPLYFPMFEEILDKNQMPEELKYLAVVESALDPTARSRAGATGLWQFMYYTGKLYGLKANSYVDARSDPRASTEAACAYLTHLYKLFGDWNLALAAYNCGEGRVARAIRRSGGKKDYWDIYPYLPRETRGYVPAFIAVNYVFNHSADHGIYAEAAPHHYFELDTVHLKRAVSFETIAQKTALNEDEIKSLNPTYKLNYIPEYLQPKVLTLPKPQIGLWVSNEDSLYAAIDEAQSQAEEQAVVEPPSATYYTVRSGDYLGRIAARNGCTVRQIQQWNGLRSTYIKPGQKLILYPTNTASVAPKNTQPQVEVSGNVIYYKIQSGDTLWDIAKARGMSVEELKRMNSHLNFNRLKPGSNIVVGKS